MKDTRQRAVDMMSKTRALKTGDFIEDASALGKAAFIGQVQVVRELLQRPDIEINFRDPKAGSSAALHYACESSHMEIIKLLVDHGATIDITDESEFTPFLIAAEMKSLEVVRYLEEKGADINRVTEAGLTSIHLAAMGNSVLILEHLLRSPKLTHTISTKSEDGRVPLFCAVKSGSLDTARFLLKRSGPTDILGKTDDGHTCLHYAVISGKPKLVSLLLDSGICHYDQTEEGFTALHYAVKRSNPDLLCTLLDHIDRVTLGTHNPFAHPAIVDTSAIRQNRQGAWTVQDFGSKRFLDLSSRSGKTAMQLLISAEPFTNEHKEMVVDLASCVGIDLENPDREKRTPLVSLASQLSNNPDNTNFHSALRALLELGVDANAKDRTGRTALHYLCGARKFTHIMYQAIADFIIGEEWTAESLLDPLPLPGAPIGPPPPPPPPPPGIRLLPVPSKKNHVLPKPHGPPPPPPPPPPTVSIIWKNVSGTARVDIPNQSKETALQAFFRSMNRMQNSNQPTEIALRLLELSPNGELDCQLPDGNQLFNTVIINKNDKLITKLYDLGINTQYRDSTLNLRSPLELFCIWGARDLKVLKQLISNCKNLSELDINGLSLLHLACDYGHLKVVRELLDGGIDVNIESRERATALSCAVAHGHTSIVELLLENGATVQAGVASRNWKTCLLNQVSNATICRLLDDRGVNDWTERSSCTFQSIFIPDFSTSQPIGQNRDRRISRLLTRLTPLHYVAYFGRLDVFKYVVEHIKDVNLNIEAEFGITPLFFAILNRNQALVTFLLEHGAKVNARYHPRRWTMLHLAAFIGDKWVALELLSNGADPCATNSSSLTPSILALQMGHLELSSTLQDEEKTRKPECE
jgi:ankyrin repeat protein